MPAKLYTGREWVRATSKSKHKTRKTTCEICGTAVSSNNIDKHQFSAKCLAKSQEYTHLGLMLIRSNIVHHWIDAGVPVVYTQRGPRVPAWSYTVYNTFRLKDHRHAPISEALSSFHKSKEAQQLAYVFQDYILQRNSVETITNLALVVLVLDTSTAYKFLSRGHTKIGLSSIYRFLKYIDEYNLPIDRKLLVDLCTNACCICSAYKADGNTSIKSGFINYSNLIDRITLKIIGKSCQV